VLAILVITISGSSGGTGGHAAAPSADSRAQGHLTATRVIPPENCPSVRKALRYYTAQYLHWTGLRVGAVTHPMPAGKTRCPRYLLHIRQAKARAARKAWNAYFHYQYAWSDWLPGKWARIAICETPITKNGHRTMNWRHSNSSYEGAFGFAKSSWDSFKYRADPKAGPYPEDAWQATPRQQYEVALAIWRMFGFSGWGCRNA